MLRILAMLRQIHYDKESNKLDELDPFLNQAAIFPNWFDQLQYIFNTQINNQTLKIDLLRPFLPRST